MWRIVETALATLTHQQRHVWLLTRGIKPDGTHTDRLTQREVAEQLNISRIAVRQAETRAEAVVATAVANDLAQRMFGPQSELEALMNTAPDGRTTHDMQTHADAPLTHTTSQRDKRSTFQCEDSLRRHEWVTRPDRPGDTSTSLEHFHQEQLNRRKEGTP